MRRSALAAIAAIGSVSLLLAGCSKADDNKDGGTPKAAGANAATKGVVNASTKKGGTVTYEMSDVPDSFDPGNTYYAYMYNLSRLYARPLMTFQPGPGTQGNTLVPDLAESKGASSEGGKTWTYKLRSGLKYQDGSPITSKDVKYAVERSNFARDVLSLGPNYFQQFLKNPDKYKGPYKDKTGNLSSIETPNDTTIVFHLNRPFQEFDYLVAAPQTAPVPQAKDDGVDYVKHIMSSGSYQFQSYQEGKQAVLVRNKNWDPKTDPLRKQYPDKIVVNLKVNADTIDKDLQAGDATAELTGLGVGASTQASLLNSADGKASTDNTFGGRLVYAAINTKVKPFDNVECRKAVEYAIDKVAVQTAQGGPIRGEVASTVLPPDIPGYQKADVYATPDSKGDVAKAKDQLKACGHTSITTNISARSDRQQEMDAATAIIDSLKKVGINATLKSYPQGKYFNDYAGVPTFTEKQNIGIMMMQWGADWPSGYGFLQQILNSSAISQSGNTNLSQFADKNVDNMLAESIAAPDLDARNKLYAQIDKATMDQAVIVPLTYFKVLLYRSPYATNVTSSSAWSGQYDYLNIGTTKK